MLILVENGLIRLKSLALPTFSFHALHPLSCTIDLSTNIYISQTSALHSIYIHETVLIEDFFDPDRQIEFKKLLLQLHQIGTIHLSCSPYYPMVHKF